MCKISDLITDCVDFQKKLRINGAILSRMLARKMENGSYKKLHKFTDTIQSIPHTNQVLEEFISKLDSLKESTNDFKMDKNSLGMIKKTIYNKKGDKKGGSYFTKLPIDEQETILLRKKSKKEVMEEYDITCHIYYQWVSGQYTPDLMMSLIREKRIVFKSYQISNIGAKFILTEGQSYTDKELSDIWGWSVSLIRKLRNGESHEKVLSEVTK
jgi:hypothetical protein